jgi:hypothetical protein
METHDADGATETVATREWVIREVDADGVLVDQVPDGGSARLARGLLPDDVSEGDRFRVVAQLDRRGRRGGGDAPWADASDGEAGTYGPLDDGAVDPRAGGSGRLGGVPEDADDAPFEVPAAMQEALRNLS